MAGAEQVTSISVQADTSQFQREMQGATDAAKKFQDSVAPLSNSTQQTSQQVTVTAQSFAKLAAALDPAVKSANQYAAAEKQITAALAAGISTQEQANRLLDLAADKYNTVEAQARKATKAQTDAQTQAAAAAKAGYDQLMASINPVVAKQQEQAKAQTTVNNALNAGKISAIGAVGAMAQFSTAQKAMGDGTKLTAQQLFVFEAQIRQFADQVISGGGFLRPFAQQAPVAIESLGGVGNAFKLLKNNMGLILGGAGIGAVVAGFATLAVSAESNQRSINQLSNGLQKYGGDWKANAALINDSAKEMAATTSIGTQEARDAMGELASAPGFRMTKENLISTTKAVKDLAAGFGISTQQAAQFVTKIFADPAAAALDGLNQHVEGFDTNFVAMIQDLERQGKFVEATNLVFNKFSTSVKGASDNVTPLQQALRNLTEAFTGVSQGANGAGSSLGTGLTNALAGAVNDVASLVKAIGGISTAFEQMGISGKTQIELVTGLLLIQFIPGVKSAEAALIKMGAVKFTELIAGLAGVEAALNKVTTASNTAATAGLFGKAALLGTLLYSVYQQAQQPIPLTNLPPNSPLLNAPIPPDVQKQLLAQPFYATTIQRESSGDPNAVNKASGASGLFGILPSTMDDLLKRHPGLPRDVNNPLIAMQLRQDNATYLQSQLGRAPTEEEEHLAWAVGPGAAAKAIQAGPGAQMSSVLSQGAQNINPQYAGKTVGEVIQQVSHPGQVVPPPAPTPPEKTGPAKELTADEQLQQFLGKGPTPGATLEEQQRQLHQLLDTTNQWIASGKYSGDALDKLKQHAIDLSAAIYNNVDPLTKVTRQQQDQIAVENQLNVVQQKTTQAVQEFTRAYQQQYGAEPSAEQKAKVAQGVLEQLAAGYKQTINAADQAAQSQGRISNAYEQSAASGLHAANQEKARQAIAGNSPTIDSAQAAAIALVTQKLDEQTAASQRNALAQQHHANESQNRILDVTEATLGSSAKVQASALAGAQTREQLINQGVDMQTDAAKRAVSESQQLGARTIDVDREKAAWNEVEQTSSQALDTMGQGLTSVLSTGKWDDFGNAGKQVLQMITNEFLKLALLNPIKNLLIPGSNQPTLFSLFNNTTGSNSPLSGGGVSSGTDLIGGSSSGGGGGFSLGGSLGGIGGMFSKTGFFGSEGELFGANGMFSATGFFGSEGALFGSTGFFGSAGFLASLFHEGGVVGENTKRRYVPVSAYRYAPRLHSGGFPQLPQFSTDEVPAILKREELVLTRSQQALVAGRMGQQGKRPVVITPNITVNTPDADSFRKSRSQVATETARSLSQAAKRM